MLRIALFLGTNIAILLILSITFSILGFDNLLYISIESKRVPEKDQSKVRKLGIGLNIDNFEGDQIGSFDGGFERVLCLLGAVGA